MEVVRQNNFIVIQEDGVNKCVDQHLALCLIRNVHLSELFEEETKLFFGNSRLCQFLAGDLVLQFILCGFQSIQPFFGRTGQKSLLNGVQQIVNGGLCFSQLLLVQRKIDVFFILQGHQRGNNRINGRVIHQHFHRCVDNHIFQPLLADGLFMTVGAFFLNRHALVIVMNNSRSARSAFAAKICAAVAAKQFGCQQIIILCLMSGRGFSVFCHLFLYSVEQLFRNNGGNTIGNNDISEGVFAHISTIGKHPLDTIQIHIPSQ